MIKKLISIALVFYLIALAQSSFAPYLLIWLPNFSLILVGLINLLEPKDEVFGFGAAFLGGFFLDVFSENFFGYYVIISLAIALLLKGLLKNIIR
ncbi:MAG: hypothetical protein GF370_04110 [Candidatus Nealsonbacteria bacterium]|nr:hypothetical protein [Candidatus Nealsonbacteria bacterium]